MNITSVSNQLSSSATSSLQPASGSPPVADQDGDGGTHRAHHGKGGGHVMSAVGQALQSLGLSLPQPGPASSSSSSTSSSDGSGEGSADGSVKNDLRNFMHQLFQAAKAEGGTAPSATSGTATSGDPQSGFASGLSALISQVGNGTAPAALQSAFTQLASDLSPGAGTAATGSAAAPSLQAFLTQLQQDLGYATSGGANAAGALVATQV